MFSATGTKNLHAPLGLSLFHMERLGCFTGVSFPHPGQLLTSKARGGLIPEHEAACSSWGPQNLPSRQRRRSGASSHIYLAATWLTSTQQTPKLGQMAQQRWLQHHSGAEQIQHKKKTQHQLTQEAGDCIEELIHE